MAGDLKTQLLKVAPSLKGINVKEEIPDVKKQEGKKGQRSQTPQERLAREGEGAPKRVLPLYTGLGRDTTIPFLKEKKDCLATANTGLLFDKFCDHWSGEPRWKEDHDTRREKDIPKEEKDFGWNANPKTGFLKAIAKQCRQNEAAQTLLKEYNKRRRGLLEKLKGRSESFQTSWRFVSGLGMGHVLETGFVWHRTLGVPYLPGSSVKGLIRSWVDPEKIWGPKDKCEREFKKDGEKWKAYEEDTNKWGEYKRLFGDSDNDGAGSLIVFDVIPTTKPTLDLDVMNPHYGDYYGQKTMEIEENGTKRKIDTPPADYLSPVPIFFLTVAADQSFEFALAPRPGVGAEKDLEDGFKLLKEALNNLGAGAKTAVGYGRFGTNNKEVQ